MGHVDAENERDDPHGRKALHDILIQPNHFVAPRDEVHPRRGKRRAFSV
jgi:hypothetical protein